MPTIPTATDNAPTKREVIMTAGLVMAREAVDRADDFDGPELLRCFIAFMANLSALGVTIPQAAQR